MVENAEVIRRLFTAVEARDVSPMYDIYSPDVVVREADSLPYGGEYHGHAGVLAHGLGYVQTWDRLQHESDRRLDAEFSADDDHVFVRWRQRAHGRDGGALDLPAVSVYELRDGRVTHSIMHHLDTAALLAFLERQR